MNLSLQNVDHFFISAGTSIQSRRRSECAVTEVRDFGLHRCNLHHLIYIHLDLTTKFYVIPALSSSGRTPSLINRHQKRQKQKLCKKKPFVGQHLQTGFGQGFDLDRDSFAQDSFARDSFVPDCLPTPGLRLSGLRRLERARSSRPPPPPKGKACLARPPGERGGERSGLRLPGLMRP